MVMNSSDLEKKLKQLYVQSKILRLELDTCYNNSEKRSKTFDKIKEIKKEIENVKFKIKLEKELKKYENNNTN